MTNSRCADCDGEGRIHTHRRAVFLGGLSLDAAMRDPDRGAHGCQSFRCETCDGAGWVPGFVAPL
jgi:DnaJ-class molecular chaperone